MQWLPLFTITYKNETFVCEPMTQIHVVTNFVTTDLYPTIIHCNTVIRELISKRKARRIGCSEVTKVQELLTL